MYRIILHPRAEKELLESVVWYEDLSQGLGNDFLKETEKILHHLEIHPYIYSKKKRNYREGILKRFPFVIIFTILPKIKEVHVLSVFHTSQHPKKKYK